MAATVTDVVTLNLQTEAALDQWDQPPSIDFILKQENGDITLEDLGVPLSLWAVAPPHVVVTGIAAIANQQGMPQEIGPSSGTIIGVTIHTEAWAFLGSSAFTEEEKAHFNELAELMENESVAGHPEAVESKMILALTDDGESVMCALRRDTGEVAVYDTNISGYVDGRMLHALGHLLDAFKECFS